MLRRERNAKQIFAFSILAFDYSVLFFIPSFFLLFSFFFLICPLQLSGNKTVHVEFKNEIWEAREIKCYYIYEKIDSIAKMQIVQ